MLSYIRTHVLRCLWKIRQTKLQTSTKVFEQNITKRYVLNITQ